MSNIEIPKVQETITPGGGCNIDWSWLTGEEIVEVGSDLQNFVIRFASGLVLKVQALQWNGAPFLSFDPYQPPPDHYLPRDDA